MNYNTYYNNAAPQVSREERKEALRKRVKRVHAKAEAVGIVYLLATIILTAAVCLPLYAGTTVGNMWVVNFWKPFLEIGKIKNNIIPVALPIAVSVLYAFVLLTALINFFKTLGCLGKLFKTKWTDAENYNRNRSAMEKMAKNFFGTYRAMIIFGFIMHLIAGVTFTTWFYVAVVFGLILHFWLGLVGGNVSRFVFTDMPDGSRSKEEMKRPIGRFAPFMRNLVQIIIVALVMWFISQINMIPNALALVEKGALANIFKGPKFNIFYYGGLPVCHFLLCLFTLFMFNHAIGLSEYEFPARGKKAKGRKSFGWSAFFLFLVAGATFGLTYYASTRREWFEFCTGSFYIAVLALAAMILELSTRRLPNVKGKLPEPVKETEPAPAAAPAVPANGYHIPLQCITQPAVFMQPNGQPIMVMPMMAGARPAPAPVYDYTTYDAYTAPNAACYSAAPSVAMQAVAEAAKKEEVGSTLQRPEDYEPKMNGPVGGTAAAPMTKEQADADAARNARGRQLANKWMDKAQNPGFETEGFSGRDFLRLPKTEAVRLSKEDLEKPLPAKHWAVACPDCGKQLNVKEGSFAYRCPDCGEVFRINRVYKNK